MKPSRAQAESWHSHENDMQKHTLKNLVFQQTQESCWQIKIRDRNTRFLLAMVKSKGTDPLHATVIHR